MPVIVNTEYGNVNAGRVYPFEDGSTLTDVDGAALPYDFIVDASLHPFDVADTVYLQSIDTGTGELLFASTATRKVVAYAVADANAASAPVYEYNGYDRQVGVIVFGLGVADVAGGRLLRTFEPEATTLCACACAGVVQAGVRALLLPDGTIVTGDITFEGQDGVLVTSTVNGSGNVLRFDLIGLTPPSPETCNQDVPICTLKVEQEATSTIVVSRYGGALALTLKDLDMDTICAAAKAALRPQDNDACDPAPPPPGPAPGTATSLTFNLCEGAGVLAITAPSSPAYRNPVTVKTATAPASGAGLDIPPGSTLAEAEDAADTFTRPGVSAGSVIIKLTGLGRNKLP